MVAAAVVALYFWAFFSKSPDIGESLAVNLPAVALAGATVIVSFISYLWSPKNTIFPVTLAIYLLLEATVAALVISTGDITSPFITLWVLVGVFAGVFGLWGSLPILIAVGTFVANQYISGGLTNEVIIIVIFSSLLPLIASLIVWHEKSGKDDPDSEEKALRNLENKLSEVASKSEVVINAIGDGVIVIDNQGIIQLINPAAQTIIGWGKQDALALNYKSVLQFVGPKDEQLEDINDPIRQALNVNQQIRTNSLTLMTKSDKKLTISLVVSPIGETGSGVIVVFHDVTKEKAEEREQAEFISTASHEMRTPVASIEGYLGLTLNPQTAQVDNRARSYILKAHASAEHLGHLLQDLLDVSKADDGRLSNNPKVINIVTFVRDIVQGLEQKATAKGLILTYKPMPENSTERHIAPAFSVNLDNDHIREIINNLVENAIKYTSKGEIVVDVTGEDDRVIVSVKDSGIGIPAEDMPHLFQKFYRVDNKGTREIGGTGLGLYLSRRLAEIIGGRIWAESIYSSGSTFYVEFPRISSQEASRLTEIEAVKTKQEADKIATNPPEPILFTPEPEKTALTSEPVNPVPRSGSLTPEEIAKYVTQQRVLARQQPAPQTGTRPNSISIPVRGPQ
ncbi:MAG TPA: ATP-binding protein [Candidatus Angelobacter sp.]|nr:ATP-binding protein [Candidatus Angelobacter sp.]